jgi:hypothetical protein
MMDMKRSEIVSFPRKSPDDEIGMALKLVREALSNDPGAVIRL